MGPDRASDINANQNAGRARGRGLLFRAITESQSNDGRSSTISSSSSESTSGISGGRGKFLDMLRQSSSGSDGSYFQVPKTMTSGSSDLSSNNSRPIGRGQAIQALLGIQRASAISGTSGGSGSSSEATGDQTRIEKTSLMQPTTSKLGLPEPTTAITQGLRNIQVQESQSDESVIRMGKFGHPVNVKSNYLRLKCDPTRGIFEYEVQYNPQLDNHKFRSQCLYQNIDVIGKAKIFDGVNLMLPNKLPNDETVLHATHPVTGKNIEIFIIYKRQKQMGDCVLFYNLLFNRVMKTLNFVRHKRKQFDPTAPLLIPQHKLEVWPGYITAVDYYEGGLMLCLDVSHRILSTQTVLETLTNIHISQRENFRRSALTALLGSLVMTRYNNKTYRIDDIDFDMNPMSTFQRDGQEISFAEYYKTQYNITIRDLGQPLLINRVERRVVGKEKPDELTFCLIPEISYLTGLTDEMRKDTRVLKNIATHTKVNPNQRLASLKSFCRNIKQSKEASEILQNWGLTIADDVESMTAREINREIITFGDKQINVNNTADFNREITNSKLIEVVNLLDWVFIVTRNDLSRGEKFLEIMQRNSRPMGVSVASPKVEILPNDRTETFVEALRRCITAKTQIVVVLCPTARDDRYAAIKKICCAELPVPSQVINSQTLANDVKNRGIVQKIALQMNCKMGGSLWCIDIPWKKLMVCGIDTYHDPSRRNSSVGALVASLNSTFTKWSSFPIIQSIKEEFLRSLCDAIRSALQAFYSENNYLPDKILVYRDGVGDGQLKFCEDYEVSQMEEAVRSGWPDYVPKFTFVVVQKRINTRIFSYNQADDIFDNPRPGTVLDHTVTKRYRYDFYLVSQCVRQGTVTPSHYIVVSDTANFPPDILQRLTYKLCFLYYNWPGTIRVPACCQYAHKLAQLVGQHVKRNPSEKLQKKLYYL